MSAMVINQFWTVLGQPDAHPSFRAAAEAAQRLAAENPGRTFFVMNLQSAYCASVEVSSLPIERPLTTETPLPDAGPQSEDDGWIKWDGGDAPPVADSTSVSAKLRDGWVETCPASHFRWAHLNIPSDIVAYKVEP
jgi:hypothetical protein